MQEKLLAVFGWWKIAIVLFFLSFAVSYYLYSSDNIPADAAQIDAHDVIGQRDGSGNPLFTTEYEYGVSPANPNGYIAPSGSLLDEVNHRLYIADTNNNRVVVHDLDINNNLIDRDADYVLGQPGLYSDDWGGSASSSAATFYRPSGLALDVTGNRLFVADTYNHRVLVFDVTTITDGESAVSVLGQVDFNADASAITQAGFNLPRGLTFDPITNRLFVADSNNHRTLIFDVATITNGENAVNVLGQTDFVTRTTGLTQSKFSSPYDVTYATSTQYLYVVDYNNYRVMVFDVATTSDGENAIHVLGQSNFTTRLSGATQSRLYRPRGATYDAASSTLYVADSLNYRVVTYDVSTIVDGENAVAVLGQPDFTTRVTNTTQSGMRAPAAVSFGTVSQQLYVVDASDDRILVYDAPFTNGENATDVLGQSDHLGNPLYTTNEPSNANPGPNGFGSYLTDIVIDHINHKLYVADWGPDRILVFDLDVNDNLLDYTADAVLGQPDFLTDDPPITSSTTFTPWGLALDQTNERLYVADKNRNRVLVFEVATTTNGMPASYVLGQPDFVSSGSGRTQSTFNFSSSYDKTGITYDATGERLFVSDSGNNRVMVFDTTALANGMNASAVLGAPDFVTDANPGETSGPNIFYTPEDLIYDEARDWLIVSDLDNYRIMVFDVAAITNGEDAIHVVGKVEGFYDDASWTGVEQQGTSLPSSLAYDETNQILFVRNANYWEYLYLYDFSTVTDGEQPIMVMGQSSWSYEDFARFDTIASTLYYPAALYFDNQNDVLFLGQGYRILVVDVPPLSSTTPALLPYDALGQVNASGTADFYAQGSNNDQLAFPHDGYFDSATELGFGHPHGVEIDTVNHRMFVADGGTWFSPMNDRIMVYDLDVNDQLIDTVPDYVLGAKTFDFSVPSKAGPDGFWSVRHMVYDAARDYLFVVDASAGRVLVFDVATINDGEDAIAVLGRSNTTEWIDQSAALCSQSHMVVTHGIAYDSSTQRLFVSDVTCNRVLVFDVSTITDGEAAISVIGQANFTDNGAAVAQNRLDEPSGLAYDESTDRLFVTDSENERVLVFDAATTTNGMNADYVLGQPDFVTNTPSASQSTMSNPVDVSIDESGQRAYITEYDNNRTLVFDVSTSTIANGMNADYVLGQPDFVTNTAVVAQNRSYRPVGVKYLNDELYIAEQYGFRVMKYDVASTTNGENAVDVLGQSDYLGNPIYTDRVLGNNYPNPMGVDEPTGTALDPVNHRFFVADSLNNRVLVYNLDANNVLTDRTADFVLGQPDFLGYEATRSTTSFSTPQGLAYDATNDRLFVADKDDDRVMVFDTTVITNGEPAVNVLGKSDYVTYTCQRTQAGLCEPIDVVYDEVNDLLYVLEDLRVKVFDVAAITDGENAINVLGATDYTSSSECSNSQGCIGVAPQGIALSTTTDTLFVSDTYNNRVLTFDVAAITDGENATNVIGQPDFDTAQFSVSSTSLSYPMGIAINERDDLLYLSDLNKRVLTYDISTITNGMPATAALGVPDMDSWSIHLEDANPYGIRYPSFLTYGNGTLFVTDKLNNRISLFAVASSTVASSTLSATNTSISVSPSPATTSDLVTVTVTTYDTLGALYGSGGDTVVVDVTGANTATPAVTDNSDGTYTATYTPTASGTDQITATINAAAVGSDTDGTSDGTFNLTINATSSPSTTTPESSDTTTGTRVDRTVTPDHITLIKEEPGKLTFDALVSAKNSVKSNRVSALTDGGTGVRQIGVTTNADTSVADTIVVQHVDRAPVTVVFPIDVGPCRSERFSKVSGINPQDTHSGSISLAVDYASVPRGQQSRLRFAKGNDPLVPSEEELMGRVLTPLSVDWDEDEAVYELSSADLVGWWGVFVCEAMEPMVTPVESFPEPVSPAVPDSQSTLVPAPEPALPLCPAAIDVQVVTEDQTGVALSFPTSNVDTSEPAGNYTVTVNSVSGLDVTAFTSGLVDAFESDRNRGHGNDPDGCDPDNPGKSKKCPPGRVRLQTPAVTPYVPLPAAPASELVTLATRVVPTTNADCLPRESTEVVTVTELVPPSTPAELTDSLLPSDPGEVGAPQAPESTDEAVVIVTTDHTLPPLYPDTVIEGDQLLPIEVIVTDPEGEEVESLEEPITIELTHEDFRDAEFVVILTPSLPEGTWFDTPYTVVNENTVTVELTHPGMIFVWLKPKTALAADALGLGVAGEGQLLEPIQVPKWQLDLIAIIGFLSGLVLLLYRVTRVPFTILGFGPHIGEVINNLLTLLALKKRRRPWGTVYDSATKIPVDPAYVELFDLNQEKVASAITDLDGRYGFLVDPGTYTMQVRKVNYHFPSTRVRITGKDVLYQNLYYGGPLEVDDSVNADVPMDPEAFDWNQYEKVRTKQTKFIRRFDPVLVRLLDALFLLGAIVMVWQLISTPSPLSFFLTGLYLITYALRLFAGRPILYGHVSQGGKALPFALLTITQNGREVKRVITDKYGRYFALVSPGNYQVAIAVPVADGQYQELSLVTVRTKQGVINKRLRVSDVRGAGSIHNLNGHHE